MHIAVVGKCRDKSACPISRPSPFRFTSFAIHYSSFDTFPPELTAAEIIEFNTLQTSGQYACDTATLSGSSSQSFSAPSKMRLIVVSRPLESQLKTGVTES
jgi:hypothetical protein